MLEAVLVLAVHPTQCIASTNDSRHSSPMNRTSLVRHNSAGLELQCSEANGNHWTDQCETAVGKLNEAVYNSSGRDVSETSGVIAAVQEEDFDIETKCHKNLGTPHDDVTRDDVTRDDVTRRTATTIHEVYCSSYIRSRGGYCFIF